MQLLIFLGLCVILFVKVVTVLSVRVLSFNASFGEIYYGNVSQKQGYLFSFKYLEIKNEIQAVRVSVSSSQSSSIYPLLFVVRQQRSITSWQLPLYLDDVYDYNYVSRTLCPVENSLKQKIDENQHLILDVTTSNPNLTLFSLNASIISNFSLSTNEERKISVSPSEPQYFQYEFGHGEEKVMVMVESEDDICMIVSIQNTHCPIYDLVRNVEFTGIYQTMTRKSALTVERNNFDDGVFYVVFVVKPADTHCARQQQILPLPTSQSSSRGNELFHREKSFTVRVHPTLDIHDYYLPVFGAVFIFFIFYIGAAFLSITYHFCHHNRASTADVLCRKRSRSKAKVFDQSLLSSVDVSATYGATEDGLPVGSANEYHSRTVHSSTSPVRQLSSLTESVDSSGVPHRISQLTDSDDSSDDLDKLNDIYEDKNVYRTKLFLYVSDLSRKKQTVLSKKYKLYHWYLVIISIFYGLPVVQLVITYQQVLRTTGNEDICFYNFYCAHPFHMLSAFNSVFSNIGYVMLGILFLGLTWRRDYLHKQAIKLNPQIELCGIPQHFGLFYAMGIALLMEGILSGCYHVCPSYSNFQFDTAYMYMLAGLLMLKIYQIRHPDVNASAHIAYMSLAIVIFVGVIGVVYESLIFWIFFTIFFLTVSMVLTAEIYYMGRWKLDLGLFRRVYLLFITDGIRCFKPLYKDRTILLLSANLVNLALAIYGVVYRPNFATLLLAIFMINLFMYFVFYITMKLRYKERILFIPLVYILLACFFGGCASFFFFKLATSWEDSPAGSRALNQPCILLNFYDVHDIWHFFSAYSMFFSFMMLLHLDDDLIHVPRNRIPVF